ncbi:hypothetical protein CXU22_03265 [Akkermansia muciniphila]|uniref:DNA methylase adenine-specific domain-containing protein n=1 Tax=Akkermansia muciniphila TaxID=239935 RepID=A0A2N8HEZ4_9BACT|nr:N-6 DNA methylase [Akkermansia muciniphila]PNC18829.1 hypothetical protein CXU22_03265 [Akkermansia muciniphila]
MSKTAKTEAFPVVGRGGRFWKILQSADWQGESPVKVLEEFIDIAFHTFIDAKVDFESRPLFRKDCEKKKETIMNAYIMLGEEMEREPYRDLLGRVHQEISSTKAKDALCSFYTPDSVCGLMAGIGIDVEAMCRKISEGKTVSVYEPACGAGRLMLAVAEQLGELRRRLRVVCEDIDLNACKMCYINLSMWGVPAEVYHMNVLSREVWGGWRTLPLAVELAREEQERQLRRNIETMQGLFRREEPGEQEPGKLELKDPEGPKELPGGGETAPQTAPLKQAE